MRVLLLEKNGRKPYMDMIPDLSIDGGILLAAVLDDDDIDNNVKAKDSVVGVLYAVGNGFDLLIRYIYVDEGFRRRGVARTLMKTLYTMAQPLLSERILSSFVLDDLTKELWDFFSAMDFEEYRAGSQSGFLIGDAYDVFEKYDRPAVKCNISKLSDMDSKSFFALSDRLNEKIKEQRKENMPISGDMFWKPVKNKGDYLDESVVAFSTEGEPLGCVLLCPLSDSEVILDYMCTFEKNRGALLLDMLKTVTAYVSEVYPIKTRILCHTINSASERILKKLNIPRVENLGKVSVMVQEL